MAVHERARAFLGTLAEKRIHDSANGLSVLLNENRSVAIVFASLPDLIIERRGEDYDAHLERLNGVLFYCLN